MEQMFLEDFNYIERYELFEDSEAGEKKFYLRGVFSRVDHPNKNKRIYSRDVMEDAINEASDMISNRGLVGELDHPCYTYNEYQVLAKEGWKEFINLNVEDEVATVNEHNIIEYHPIQQIINEPYKGKVYHFSGRNIDSTVTPTHRFYLEDRYGKRQVATAKEIYKNRKKYNHSKIIKIGSWDNDTDEVFKIDNLELNTKDFMSFMGIYLSEGWVEKNNIISISQNEGEIADKIRELLNRLPFEYKEFCVKSPNSVNIKFSIKSVELNNYLKKLGKCYDKYIPHELKQMDAPYLEELLEWFIFGDGRDQRHYEKGNRRNFFSVSKRLIEDLHEILIKTGGSGNWTEINDSKDYIFSDHLIEAKNKSTLYQLNISTTKGIYLDERFLEIIEEEYEGNVYCLTVENGNFFIKDKNKTYITGNSTPKINVKGISHVITKLHISSDGAVLGEAEALNTEPGRTLKELMEANVRLGVSTRGVGTVEPYNGPLVREGTGYVKVKPGYRMKAIDIVFDPSQESFPSYVKEELEHHTEVLLGYTKKISDVLADVFNY